MSGAGVGTGHMGGLGGTDSTAPERPETGWSKAFDEVLGQLQDGGQRRGAPRDGPMQDGVRRRGAPRDGPT
ncbi:hypothetical protein [Streptomyces sp. NPDC004728]|uniref:hypothetical protein n=1 Tax=Streptomyces sp. NPDC004728 TaxID=3154289 RepID=UPI0033AF8860